MTRKEAQNRHWMLSALQGSGISLDDADKLRRISMTLHRWHELECGTGDGRVSVSVERDETTGKPYIHTQYPTSRNGYVHSRHPTPDRETGALKRLAAIMARYSSLQSYVQGDPRGCALYVLRPGDVAEGGDPSAYYSRGIAVY